MIMSDVLQKDDLKSFSGAESFLVGLSPQYWAHTPLTIADVQSMGVVDGIDCMIFKTTQLDWKATTDNNEGEPSKRRKLTHTPVKFVPVSKCRIEGVVVNVEQKSNGSVLYLIDDGTGLIDCIAWYDDVYSLPPLVETPSSQSSKSKFRVGDVVRVLGKIRCMSVGTVTETVLVAGKQYEVRDAIREIQSTIMEHATDRYKRPKTLILNSESKHWLDCMQFHKKAANPAGLCGKDAMDSQTIYNGAEMLGLLGREITASVVEQSEFPSSDDSVGAWRVFGMNCQCNLPYKEPLLYCHCQAKANTFDREFIFRDAILETLLRMEGDLKIQENEEISVESQLRFQYKTLVHNKDLKSVAERVVSSMGNPSVAHVQRVFISTFSALRSDGIVFLESPETDTYIFLSRKRVLEPYVKKISSKDPSSAMERKLLMTQPPAYLVNVPNARLQYIKKCLWDKRKDDTGS